MDWEVRFFNMVQMVLNVYLVRGNWPRGNRTADPDLYDITHCLNDAYFYARNNFGEIDTMNLASLAQQYVVRWLKGDPSCKRN